MMMQFFPNRTIQTIAFLSFCLLFSGIFGCQQDTKTAAPAAPETTTAAPVTRETAPVSEDLSAAVLAVSDKKYEPLARKIVANREKLKSLKATRESSSELRNEGEAKDQEKQQLQVEAGFVDNMKILDALMEKQNSKEMDKAQLDTERKKVSKNLKEIEITTTTLEKTLESAKN